MTCDMWLRGCGRSRRSRARPPRGTTASTSRYCATCSSCCCRCGRTIAWKMYRGFRLASFSVRRGGTGRSPFHLPPATSSELSAKKTANIQSRSSAKSALVSRLKLCRLNDNVKWKYDDYTKLHGATASTRRPWTGPTLQTHPRLRPPQAALQAVCRSRGCCAATVLVTHCHYSLPQHPLLFSAGTERPADRAHRPEPRNAASCAHSRRDRWQASCT